MRWQLGQRAGRLVGVFSWLSVLQMRRLMVIRGVCTWSGVCVWAEGVCWLCKRTLAVQNLSPAQTTGTAFSLSSWSLNSHTATDGHMSSSALSLHPRLSYPKTLYNYNLGIIVRVLAILSVYGTSYDCLNHFICKPLLTLQSYTSNW